MRRTAALAALIMVVAASAAQGPNQLANALAQGQYRKALELADSMLTERPDDVRLLTMRGMALKGLQRPDSVDAFAKALAQTPDFLPALKGAAEAAYAFHDRRAEEYVGRILSREPENATANAMAGELAFEAKNCLAAVEHFGKAGPLAMRSDTAGRYGQCLIELQRADQAVNLIEEVAREHPEDSLLRLNLGICQLSANQFAAAKETFGGLLTSEVPRSVVEDHLAIAEGQLGEVQEARNHLESAIALAPNEEGNYLDLAMLLLRNGLTAEALQIANRGLQRLPQLARLRVVRGVTFAEQTHYEQAEADFEAADKLSPEHSFGLAGQSVLESRLEKRDDAAARLRARLARTPEDYFLNYLQADVLLNSGPDAGSASEREGRHALERSIASNPGFPNSHILLGKLYMHQSNWQAANSEFETALKSDPQNRSALYQLAMALRKTGRSEESKRKFQQFRDATKQLLPQQTREERLQTMVRQ